MRRGVQLEDKPLSRRSPSVRRAVSAVRKAVESVGFVPADKVEGEKRVLILVADGSEEIEVMRVLLMRRRCTQLIALAVLLWTS